MAGETTSKTIKKAAFLLAVIIFPMIAKSEDVLNVYYVEKIPFKEPYSPIWEKIEPIEINLLPQNVVAPMLKESTISKLKIRAIHNSEYIAFLLEWIDNTKDAIVNVDKFSDQVAIQFPTDPKAPGSFMMGQKNNRVHIIHWKAMWQEDIEKGYKDVGEIYPNYWVDLYWKDHPHIFGEGEVPNSPPHIIEFSSPVIEKFIPGFGVRNPLSVLNRSEPVEELMAEGFGTLTTQPNQNAKGWGEWKDGKWRVIISRPKVSDDPIDAPITEETFVAFAVWDGSKKNVGARKNFSTWIKMILKKEK